MLDSIVHIARYVPALLVAVALAMVVELFRRRRSIMAELNDTAAFLAEVRTVAPRSALARAVREHLIPAPQADRLVVARSLSMIRRDYAESAVAHHVAFWVGSLFTGIALVCTFVLIASVMGSDVSGAIRDAADPAQLSDAVEKLGSNHASPRPA